MARNVRARVRAWDDKASNTTSKHCDKTLSQGFIQGEGAASPPPPWKLYD